VAINHFRETKITDVTGMSFRMSEMGKNTLDFVQNTLSMNEAGMSFRISKADGPNYQSRNVYHNKGVILIVERK
jgi:hypothetical protein